MEFDTSNLNDEDITKINDLIYSLKKEKTLKKWWIRPTVSVLSVEYEKDNIKCFCVEEQKDSYSKDRPPVKSDFDSKEEAEKWLDKYVAENSMFNSALNDVHNLCCNLGLVIDRFERHDFMTENEWSECFRIFNESREYGSLSKVTKDE